MQAMQEIWKPVKDYECQYEVSNFGRIRSLDRETTNFFGTKTKLKGRMLRGSLLKNGYLTICFNSKTKKYFHQVVAETFLLPPQFKHTVNHKDGNKTNNHIDNLEWNTYKQNNDHARETGLNNQHGEKCNLSKYSDQFIDAVRNVHEKYNPNYEELGKLFGLTGCHARQIVLKLTRAKKTR